MTENEVLEMLLDIKEIQIDRFEVQGQSLHIHCSSVLEEVHRGFLWNLPCRARFTPSRGLRSTLGLLLINMLARTPC